MILVQNLRGSKMPKTVIVFLAFTLVFCLAASIAGADNFFEEKVEVIDSKYQDDIFGGGDQDELLISFTPGDDLTHDAGEADGTDGDWAIIVDADNDGDFNDDAVLATGEAESDSAVTYRLSKSQLGDLPDGDYEVAVIIDNVANGRIDWDGEITGEVLDLLFRIKDEYQITLVDFIRDLDDGKVSAGLLQEFEANGIPLSVEVTVIEPETTWMIADGNGIYVVRKEGTDLQVYKSLFTSDGAFQAELDDGIIPEEFRQEFDSNGITLSGGAAVAVETPGSRWMIADGSDIYDIREGASLDVFQWLFPVTVSVQSIIDELDRRAISIDLWNSFEAEDYPISVSKVTQDYDTTDPDAIIRRWNVTGSGREYTIIFDDKGETEDIDDNDELEVYSENVLLFVIRTGGGHISDLLDMDTVPEDLRQEFERNGITLAEDAEVIVEESGSKWLIIGSSYAVRKEGDKLNVYDFEATSDSVKADEDSENFVLDTTLEITQVDVDPSRFSPNGDGVNDTVSIYYMLSENLFSKYAEIVITIGDEQLSSPAKPRPGTRKGRNVVTWDGKDGLGNYVDDDIYTIEIEAMDLGGNQVTETVQVEVRTELPEIVSTEPLLDSFVSTLTEVSADLQDNSGEGIDMDKSTIRLRNPSGALVAGVQRDDGVSNIRLRISTPLPGDGTADGQYTIEVTAFDESGNNATYSSTFVYDTIFPNVIPIAPADDAVLLVPPAQIVLSLQDGNGSGPDLGTTAGTIAVRVDGVDVPGSTVHNGTDTIIFRPFEELEVGRYTVEVTPTDFAGNSPSQPRVFEFIIVEDLEDILPEVVSTEPAERESVNALSQVTVVLGDKSGKGLDIKGSTVRLENPQGVELAGVQTDNDSDTITLELNNLLPTDGSADGNYTIKIEAVDKADRTTEKDVTFLYDTQVPTITSITPSDGSLVTTLTGIMVMVSDGAGGGVDFASSKGSMRLLLDGVEIPNILRQDNGVNMMVFNFPALEDAGKYTVEITLMDKAENQYTYVSKFDFVEKPTDVLPEVSVTPSDLSFLNAVSQVTAVVQDNSGKGIDFDLSTVSLEDPNGVAVPGVQADNDADTITLNLTEALPTDGTADGTYTVKVSAVDKTGGTTEESFSFVYDTLSPSVVETSPAANDAFYEGISQVTVQLNDGTGSGVDMNGTTVELQGPAGVVNADRSDNGKNIITLDFSKLTESGNYTISIQPVDRAGNSGYPVEVKFSYVLKPPAVTSVTLTNRAYVSNLESIEAVLEDRSGVGLDLSETGSLIVVSGPNGDLQADQSIVGDNTIVWKPVHPLAKDGTDDGTYSVTVTPVDTTGASGQSRQLTLIYDTQPPEVTSASPVDINADVTYVGDQLISVQASLQDEGPAGIEIEDQMIHLETADGTQVSGVKTDNGSDTVTWRLTKPLAKDGTGDGDYGVVVTTMDQAGNQKEFRYPVIYDTVLPEVVKVVPEDNSKLSQNITQVSVELTDDGDIDFQMSGIELQAPSGGSVSGVTSNDGVGSMTLTFTGLKENGTYEVLVTAVDKAGNGAGNTWKTEFVFETGLPVVISTSPVARPPERAYTSSAVSRVTAVLQQTDGGGIDLSPTGSTISLRGPDGQTVIGTRSNDGSRTLIFTLGRTLAIDGSDDGVYTILVKAANSAKRKDDQEREYSFTYDTQDPDVASVSSLDVDADVSYVSEAITRFSATLEDEGPAGIDIDRSSIRLTSPAGTSVQGNIGRSVANTLTFSFPSGLSAEGSYRLDITAMDKAGNSRQVRLDFIYSVNVPEIVSTTPSTVPADEAYVGTQLKDVRAELRETGDSGIDLSPTGSTIRLRSFKGEYVSGVQSDNGSNVLIFTLTDPLATDGSDDGTYTISVTPVNVAKLNGDTGEFAFFYDTTAPEVDLDSITLGLATQSGSSLDQIWAVVADPSKTEQAGSGIDWENYDNSWIKLRHSSGGDVPGKVSVNESESMVILTLDVPLASNGSDDGFYTVTISPSDRAGNKPDPVVQHEFLYDTRPPTVNRAEITINDIPLLLDSSLDEYPTAVNTKNGVTVVAKLVDDGAGADLTNSSITVSGPEGDVSGSLKQDGVDTIWFTSGLLNAEGLYTVEINPVDLDENGINKSSETVSAEFLFERGKPTAQLTEPAEAEVEAEDEPITLKGTATDDASGEGVEPSGVDRVEVGHKGPGDKEPDWIWIQAEDDSDADKDPWSEWTLDLLPDASGIYTIAMRVWDKAGNSEIYDADLELTFTVSLAFQGDAYCWPNPVVNGVAHISFEINVPGSKEVPVTLFVYDVSGDLVYENRSEGVPSRARTSLEWHCANSTGEKVTTGIYVFRLEAEVDDQVANKIGKPMVIKN